MKNELKQRWLCEQVISRGLPSVMEGMRRSDEIWKASGGKKSPLECDAEAAAEMLKKPQS